MNYTHSTEIEDFDDLAFHVGVELVCTQFGEPPAPPSMNFPGEPGWGPEFEMDTILVNGVELKSEQFEALFGKGVLDGLIEEAETAASESGEFG